MVLSLPFTATNINLILLLRPYVICVIILLQGLHLKAFITNFWHVIPAISYDYYYYYYYDAALVLLLLLVNLILLLIALISSVAGKRRFFFTL